MAFYQHTLYKKVVKAVNEQFKEYPENVRMQFGFFLEIAEKHDGFLQKNLRHHMLLRELQKCRKWMKPESLQKLIQLFKEIEAKTRELSYKVPIPISTIKEIRKIIDKNKDVPDEELDKIKMQLVMEKPQLWRL